MRLAEALARRADLQWRVEQLRARMRQSALVQEGEAPVEDVEALLGQAEEVVAELERLVRGINRTNLSSMLADGSTTLTDALARRDALALRRSVIGTLVEAASQRMPRYGRQEIKILSTVEVGPLRRRMDELAKDRRELDTAVQQANWNIELME
ncbi:MAG: DIP1984 family protein [Rubrobacteraceae bacterium]